MSDLPKAFSIGVLRTFGKSYKYFAVGIPLEKVPKVKIAYRTLKVVGIED